MIASYHNHTWRCQHASGTEREYVEAAIAGGIRIFGFSDHTPMPFHESYISPLKMTFSQMDDYVTTVLNLKKEYEKDIEIHLGLEVEYYPKYFDKMVELLRPYPVEYFILGDHFLGDEIDTPSSFTPTSDPQRMIDYVNLVLDGLETGRFTYLAHPDLILFRGPDELYDQWMRKMCVRAKELSIPLEINLQGVWDHRHYPQERFWKIAGEVGNQAIIGTDAHLTDKVYLPEAEKIAEALAQKYNVEVLSTINFTDPLFF